MKPASLTLWREAGPHAPYLFPLREVLEGADFPPRPWAKVCPFCLDPWARMEIEKPGRLKQIHSVPCMQCLPQLSWYWLPNIPGSLIYNTSYQATDWDLLDDLPPVLLQRELAIHIKLLLIPDTRNHLMLTPEEFSKLQLYRQRIDSGEQMTVEENAAAVKLLRADRLNSAKRAQASKASSGTKAKKAPAQSANSLLGQLGIPGLGS